jgi:glucose/arabinose dehydrogenase
MIRFRSLPVLAAAVALSFSTLNAAAQLPKVVMKPAFPALQRVERPLWLEDVPDGSGRFLLVGQRGLVLAIRKGTDGADAKEFMNIVNRRPFIDNEEGLLGLACHPKFKENGLFYVYYTQQNPKRELLSRFKVSSTNADAVDLASEQILFTIPHPYWNHDGGQVSFGPDGYLYITSGDGGSANDPHNSGQSTSTLLAKIIRIDVDKKDGNLEPGRSPATEIPRDPNRRAFYSIPSDNPFVQEGYDVRKEIYALGLRNVWRMSWDRETGDLWAGDVGQDKWEEVDLIVKGGNYGWCVREGFHHFKPGPSETNYILPIIEYAHTPQLMPEGKFPDHPFGTSITGGYVYRGKKYPSLKGVYIYADYTLGTIFGLRYKDGKMTEHGTLLTQPKNICSFAQDSDGELYVLADDGKVYTLATESGK